MLQISSVNDNKSDWNIGETHIIIPMVDGDITNRESDKILTGALTFNSFGVGDQTILTNALEHSLIIGLDKNVFETSNYRSDLVIIQNPDIKLISCNSEIKNPVAYALSYVDQDKNEILLQGSVSKDKMCMNSRGVLEVKDVLNYDDSTHELEKTQPQINLDNVNSDVVSQVSETNSEILRGDVCKDRKESHFMNCYSEINKNNSVPILSHLDSSKFIVNVRSDESKKNENTSLFKPKDVSNSFKSEKNSLRNILNTTKSEVEFTESKPSDCTKQKINKGKNISINVSKNTTRHKQVEGKKDEKVKNVLSEKSLPLKKKAKMKRTLMFSSENQISLLKQGAVVADPVNVQSDKKLEKASAMTNSSLKEESFNSDSDEPLISKIIRRKKKKSNAKSKKLHMSSVGSLLYDNGSESKAKNLSSSLPKKEAVGKINCFEFDKNKFNNIFDLVDCLRKCRMINGPVWQTLNSGLKEMKVDILVEMNAKINENFSSEIIEYSPQLKAFALVLYFKQPAAFNYLSQIYKAGWPSLTVIKKWKQQMNSNQRSNFLKADTDLT